MKLFHFQFNPPVRQPDDVLFIPQYGFEGIVEIFVVAQDRDQARQLLNSETLTSAFSDVDRWECSEIDLESPSVVKYFYLD